MEFENRTMRYKDLLTHLGNDGYFSSQIMQAYCIYIHIVYQNVPTIIFKHPKQTQCYAAFTSSLKLFPFNFKYLNI